MAGLVGPLNENLRSVQEAFGGARIIARGNEFNIEGEEAAVVARLVEELRLLLEQGQVVDPGVVARTIDILRADERPSEVLTAEILRSARGRSVRPKSSGQKRYVDAIAANIVTFGIGPAGTGKSYLAVALAVQALQAKSVERIIMTRPAVEAGERLGFLPGRPDGQDRPLLTPALRCPLRHVGDRRRAPAAGQRHHRGGPPAYMRGRTLNRSFIILDEAQNATPEQLKMFLTRIGFGSKVVVNGDITQVDLPGGRSGLADLDRVLNGIEGIAFVRLTSRDVVRHRIVADIVSAYDAYESANNAAAKAVCGPRSAESGRTPVAVDVFAADEQSDHPVDTLRWVRLAEAVLEEEGLTRRCRALGALRGRGRHRRAQQQVPRQRRADRRAGVPHRRGADRKRPLARLRRDRPGMPSEPEDMPVLLGDIVICPAVAFRNAPEHAGNYDDEAGLAGRPRAAPPDGHGPSGGRRGRGNGGEGAGAAGPPLRRDPRRSLEGQTGGRRAGRAGQLAGRPAGWRAVRPPSSSGPAAERADGTAGTG